MKICIIGSGYVGLVSGACFSDLGNTVTCVDINRETIEKLNKGIIPIYEPGLQELVVRNLKKKRLLFTTDISSSIKRSDIIFICVGTPTKNNKADLKYVFNVTNSIKFNLNRYKIIVTKSTVPVTTGDKITKILKSNKNKNNFDVVSNPEFLREGEAIRDFQFPDRVVVGTSSNKANKIMKKLYLPLIKKGGRYFHTSRRSAELIKYASNAFLATKITFINEIANLCEKSNIDVKEVAIGMGLDERIGSRFLRPGPAYGGSCFPKDTRALVSTGRMFNTNLSVVKSVINSNDKRTNLLLNKISKIMNNKIKNKNITFLGVTFDIFAEYFIYALILLSSFALIGLVFLILMKKDYIRELPTFFLPNTGNMGIPICLFAYGKLGMGVAAAISSLVILLHFTANIFLAKRKFDFSIIAKSPSFYTIILTVIFLYYGKEMPVFMINTTMLLSYAMIVMILMSLGIALTQMKVFSLRDSIITSIGRVILGPIVGFFIIKFFNLSGFAAGVLLIQSSMPSAILCYLVASMYSPKKNVDNISSTIVVSTLMSLVTVPITVFIALKYFA